jgi:hypothetical protein
MPTTMTIYPYLLGNACWVFDDERTGLKEEAFVLGMTEMISRLVEYKLIPNASKGFSLSFAAEPFDHDVELNWLPPGEVAKEFNCTSSELPAEGNWYRGFVSGEEMVGWLCPALFCYFDEAPKKLFVKADPLPEGIDPIWNVTADDPRAKRFVAPPDDSQI